MEQELDEESPDASIILAELVPLTSFYKQPKEAPSTSNSEDLHVSWPGSKIISLE